MKKILVAFAIAMAAVAGNAAAFSWSSTGTIHPASDASGTLSSFTAYLISTDTISQGDLLTALRNGGSIADYASLSTYTGSGKVNTTAFDADANSLSAYFVIVDGDYVYLSKTATKNATATGTQNLSFGSQSTSSSTVFGSDTDYSSAGWYSTAAVPEPTSAMLLVLGVAALALRRKRA